MGRISEGEGGDGEDGEGGGGMVGGRVGVCEISEGFSGGREGGGGGVLGMTNQSKSDREPLKPSHITTIEDCLIRFGTCRESDMSDLVYTIRALRKRLSDANARAKTAERYLEDLTPGGSEFSGDPKFCFGWIKDTLYFQHQKTMKLIKAELESQEEA